MALKYGSRGALVKTLQSNLNKIYAYGLKLDGDFGALTEAAVRDFQTRKNLEADGKAGPLTQAAISTALRNLDAKISDVDYAAGLIAKREAMLDYIEKRVGDIYVYGAQGQLATDSIIDWSARVFGQFTTPERAERMKRYAAEHPVKADGEKLRAADCSGLFWAAENESELPLSDTYDIDDATAEGLYNDWCTPVAKSELQPLDLVFNSGLTHMAIVGRGGRVYEASGSDIGVVVNESVDDRLLKSVYGTAYGTSESYRQRAWTKFGRLKIYANAGI